MSACAIAVVAASVLSFSPGQAAIDAVQPARVQAIAAPQLTLAQLHAPTGLKLTIDSHDVTFTKPTTQQFPNGATVWRAASTFDNATATLTIAVHDEVVFGHVLAPGHALLRLTGTTNHIVATPLDHSGRCGCDADDLGEAPTELGPDAGQNQTSPTLRGGAPFETECDDGSIIDLVIAYTDVARAAAGGNSAIEAAAAATVVNMNDSFATSQIPLIIRLVGTVEVAYNEVGSYANHLDRLENPNDGNMDAATQMRDALAADAVALFVDDNDPTDPIGRAVVLNSLSASDGGYSVVLWSLADAFVLAHEIGHNLGCGHESGGFPIFPDSRGHVLPTPTGDRWSIMYSLINASTTIPHYSDPDINFGTTPTGVAGVSNNAATIRITRSTVAKFRCAIDRCGTRYQTDTGATNSFGFTNQTWNFTWWKAHTVQTGGEFVSAIEVGTGTLSPGVTITIAAWDDPNNDGDPSDAVLINTWGPITPAGPFTVNRIEVMPFAVGSAGDGFFLGATTTHPTGDFPATRDASPSNGQCFSALGNDLTNLTGNFNYRVEANNWIIRGLGIGTSNDCNENGVPDSCDIIDSTSLDGDGNGIPDECESSPCPCDWDPAGPLNSDDFFAFLSDFFAGSGDFNADGTTNSDDFFEFLNCFFTPPAGC